MGITPESADDILEESTATATITAATASSSTPLSEQVGEKTRRTTIRIAKKRRKIDDGEEAPEIDSEQDDDDFLHVKHHHRHVVEDKNKLLDDTEAVELVDDEVITSRGDSNNNKHQSTTNGETNLYKLYKIILEQTDPVVWNSSSSSENIDSKQVLVVENNQVKLTIETQVPSASVTASNRIHWSDKALTVHKSDLWSNKNMTSEDEEDLIKLDLEIEMGDSSTTQNTGMYRKYF